MDPPARLPRTDLDIDPPLSPSPVFRSVACTARYAAGAAVAGIFGDHLGLTWAIAVTAVLMILSGTFTFFAYRQNTTKIDAARVAKAKLVG